MRRRFFIATGANVCGILNRKKLYGDIMKLLPKRNQQAVTRGFCAESVKNHGFQQIGIDKMNFIV